MNIKIWKFEKHEETIKISGEDTETEEPVEISIDEDTLAVFKYTIWDRI